MMYVKPRIGRSVVWGLFLLAACGKDYTSLPGSSEGGGNSSTDTQTGVSACVAAPFGGGDGSLASPYLIATVCHLEKMAGTSTIWDKNFKMVGNIDLTGVTFEPEIDAFTGVFDGNGFTIQNWTTTVPFMIYSAGTIKNLHLSNIVLRFPGNSRGALLVGTHDVTGIIQDSSVSGTISATGPSSPSFMGGIAGVNKGAILRTSVNATVVGGESVGGAVGFNSGSVTQVAVVGTVTGQRSDVDATDGIGGLVGWNTGILTNSYSQASLIGYRTVGGLVGQNSGTLNRCYSAGIVSAGGANVGGLVGLNDAGSTIVSSYWDTDASGQASSAAGSGQTTSAMQTQGTYSGWDFSSIWNAPSSGVYPSLR